MRKTKVVCTIGPASSSSQTIERLVLAGMSVARINLSHGTQKEHIETISTIRRVSAGLNSPVAILLDLPGPKLRIGGLKKQEVHLKEGDDFFLTSESLVGDEHKVSVDIPAFFNNIGVGDNIFLSDGAVQLKVRSATKSEVKCEVVAAGSFSANQGISTPGVKLDTSSVTGEDLKYLNFAIEQGVDFIALSFVRSADDILGIRQLLQQKRAGVPLIAKIENDEGVKHIDGIIAEADGIMIARGDLGVEIPLEIVPIIQKDIIRKCNRAGKPAIVATQMLESMINAARPTRAEVSDVANAIFDGADSVMLSAETSIGRYPEQTVATMANIAVETEKVLPYERILSERSKQAAPETDDAIGYAACCISQRVGAKCIVVYTISGATALRVSKYRPVVPIIAVTPNANTVRRLTLSWGVEPHIAVEPANLEMMFQKAAELARKTGIAKRGELIVISGGIPFGKSCTNIVKVHRVE